MCMDRMEKSGYPQKPQSPVRPKPEHLAEMSRLRKKMGMMSMSSNNMPNIDNQSSSEMDVNHTVSDRSTKSSIIEKNELESESETEEEELSEESDEEEGFHASQDAKDGLLSLDLHPAHGARVTQPLSFPGCKTASKMAAAAAADRDIGKRQARLVQVDLREGKLIFSAEGQTKEITLLFAEVATEVCVGPLAQELSVIAIIPEKSAHGERRPSSAAPRRPSAFPRAVKAVFSLGSTERPSNAERLGWVLTCKTEEVPIILERLGEQGCLRNHLQACYKAANNSKMGTGSFGVVAQGTNLQNGQVVAIKALNKTAKQEEVHAEVALLVRAQGPSVVKFHGCFCDVEEKGTPRWSLVFDYHSGDLYDRVAERTRMSEKESLPYLRDLLEALAHLHAKQIFHRDVKPENLLMAKQGKGVVLTDLGISCLVTDEAEMKRTLGTVGYASPEMLKGEASSWEGDAFGAGVVLYFMLSKSTPFLAPTRKRMVELTEECHVKTSYSCFENLSDDCRTLMLQLLKKDVQERLTVEKALQGRLIRKTYVTATEPTLARPEASPKAAQAESKSGKESQRPAQPYHHLISLTAGELPALTRLHK
ncbi:Serine/threonine-protein kinase DCLK3 (CLICK-I and II-related) (CLr) (Doublecortin-like and CAM kinase-like 3) (Doublecortin-like kinase 3) [Durusdinium trenchii]|uniref:Serine/threonine-protein kinase DCLK3 (CLICK-I and II-related) (CLr) (Doublecortin-like and CAM kinase-like 3) (Doublecortin-like kinase 3) n=1 Tax=Durusdinium trenchii TaxID=1381693 RepID=A0ABP0SBT0_9DINO